MLVLKLQRVGKKHMPSFRLVVAEKRSKLTAPPVEDLGAYNPLTKKATLKKERILHWLGRGAQSTVTVHNLLVKEGVMNKPKIALRFKKKGVEAGPTDSAPAEVATPTGS